MVLYAECVILDDVEESENGASNIFRGVASICKNFQLNGILSAKCDEHVIGNIILGVVFGEEETLFVEFELLIGQ